MATSYGSLTIVDITDIGEFSVYPKANSPKVQIYDPDSNSYTPNWGNDNVIIEPVAYYAGKNVSSAASYGWKKREGNGAEVNLDSDGTETVSSNGTLTISANKLASVSSGLLTYILTATYVVDGVTLTAEGQMDFSLTKQGSTAKSAKITGENVFKYDTNQAIVGSTTITLTASVNNVSITAWQYKKSDGTWVMYPGSGTGVNLIVGESDSTFTNDTVTIKLVTDDTATYDLFTITKLRDGAAGQSVVSAVLSNEDQMLPADKDGNVTDFSGATTILTIYQGGTDVTSQWAITKTLDNVADGATDDNKAAITSISGDTGSVTFTCTKSGFNTISKVFSLVKIKTGADGETPTIYSLEPEALAVNKDESNVFTPSKVKFNAYQQKGSVKSAYNGRISFFVDGATTPSETSSTDESSREFNFAGTSNVSQVRGVLYAAGGTTTQLDSQTIVVTSDGKKGDKGDQGDEGAGAVNLILGNEADVIPCNSSDKPIAQFVIDIPFEGYQGITKKATTVTTAPSLSWSGTTINPVITNDTTGTSVGHVKYTIPTTVTVPEGGQINLSFIVHTNNDTSASGTADDVTINRIYTFTRSSAAEDGKNAVVLQIVTTEGTVFDNNTGTLKAKALLYNGATQETAGNVTWAWAQYKSGSYVNITSTSTSADVYKNAAGDELTIKAAAVDGYGSFRVTATYPKSGGQTYTQYVSLIDKADPLQVSVHSTIGTQIVNSQGKGAIYARVTRNGNDIDYVPLSLEAGETYPSSPTTGTYFVKLTGSGTTGTAKLMKYGGSAWSEVTQSCTYEWTYRDKDNNVLATNIPATSGQFVYIDATLISNKITADVKVTAPD